MTTAKRPSVGSRRVSYDPDLGVLKSGIFFIQGLDTIPLNRTDLPVVLNLQHRPRAHLSSRPSAQLRMGAGTHNARVQLLKESRPPAHLSNIRRGVWGPCVRWDDNNSAPRLHNNLRMRFRIGEIGKRLGDAVDADAGRHHRGGVDLAFGDQAQRVRELFRRVDQ